jgi:RNA ligase (TIGR02306 family)
MPSELIVKLQRIHAIKEHPNADRLSIATIGQENGWQTCIKKNVFQTGDLIIYVPPDALLPRALHEMLTITNYLAELPSDTPEAQAGYRRVKAVNLRGIKSFGAILTIADMSNYFYLHKERQPGKIHLIPMYLHEGLNVADLLDIKKWTPKEKCLDGDKEKQHSYFHKYTDIQNIRNFPDMIKQGEHVILTEKIHGSNCRVGFVWNSETSAMEWMAGSHTVQRKQNKDSKYWMPLNDDNLKNMITGIYSDNPSCFSVIVFCEVYGPGIQTMEYGLKKIGYKVFDVAVNGNYLNWDDIVIRCIVHRVTMVPELYRGPFSFDVVERYTDGPTTIATKESIVCKFKGREGIVIRPSTERFEGYRRAILKSVSIDYLEFIGKGGSDNA